MGTLHYCVWPQQSAALFEFLMTEHSAHALTNAMCGMATAPTTTRNPTSKGETPMQNPILVRLTPIECRSVWISHDGEIRTRRAECDVCEHVRIGGDRSKWEKRRGWRCPGARVWNRAVEERIAKTLTQCQNDVRNGAVELLTRV